MKIKIKTKENIFWKFFKKIAYWIIPLVILISIFAAIDVNRLLQILKMVNPWLMTLGFLICPLIIIVGAYRWKVILKQFLNHEAGLWFVIRHYWIGLAIGKFLPSSVTWDIYRVVIAGKKFGDYTFQAIGIFIEKLMAMVVACLLIISLYPFVKDAIHSDTLQTWIKTVFSQFFNKNYLLIFSGIIIIGFSGIILAGYFAFKWLRNIEINWRQDLILPLFKFRLIVPLLFSSTAIFFGMAVVNYCFFYSLNTNIPFVVHLFLMPIFAILFLLPITFAGFGLREGSFIVFYGLFGIPMEMALVVSFMNLMTQVLNSIIGGIIMLANNSKTQKSQRV